MTWKQILDLWARNVSFKFEPGNSPSWRCNLPKANPSVHYLSLPIQNPMTQ